MKTKFLKEKLAPMTKEQYEAKEAEILSEAKNMLMQIECYRKSLYINGEKYCWNGSTQKVMVFARDWHNEIPRSVALDSFKGYLWEEKDYILS